MIGHHRSDDRNSDCKGDKYPTSGVNLRRLLKITALVQDTHEKVLEKLATGDKATIVIERQSDGKMRVTSGSWDGEKVILRDQVLEVSKVEGRLHVARKPLHHDEGNP
jgi:hypothetical protein